MTTRWPNLHNALQSLIRTGLVDPTTKSQVLRELQHAQEQLALADEYPGRERSFPSDAKPIDPAPSNQASIKLVDRHEP